MWMTSSLVLTLLRNLFSCTPKPKRSSVKEVLTSENFSQDLQTSIDAVEKSQRSTDSTPAIYDRGSEGAWCYMELYPNDSLVLNGYRQVQRMPQECALELKAAQSHALVSTEPNRCTSIESILDPTKFSTLSRLIGVTAKVIRAFKRFKNARRAARREAKLLWVKSAQKPSRT